MSLGFSTALSALNAARLALETVGHNIANANTAGYSRQRVLLSAGLPQSIGRGLVVGSGVSVDSIDQVYDPIIIGRLRAQAQEVGRAGGQVDIYTDLQAAIGEPSDSGLNSRFSDFFAALTNLQTTPGDSSARAGAIQSGATLAQTFRTMASDLGAVSHNVDQAVQYEVNTANKTIQDLAELNHSIVVSGFGGQLPPDLRDKQNQLVQQLAQSVDVHVQSTPTGQILVSSAGQVLVDPNGANLIHVLPKQITGKAVALRAGSGTVDFVPMGGRLGSLLASGPNIANGTSQAIDDLAHGLIQLVNKAHATGVPPAGGYTSVVALRPFKDTVGSGNILGEKLSETGLPFDMQDGYLTVSVHDQAGNTTQTRLGIVPDQMTVQNLVTVFNQVPHLSATVDSSGRLRVAADPGYQFDFSNRLNPTPDAVGLFGGGQPTLVSAIPFPTAIAPGTTFTLKVDGGAQQQVVLQASHFANPAAATADEVAAAINSQVTGAHAFVASGHLVIQGSTVGSSGSLQFNNGITVTGQNAPVKVSVSGAYTGTSDQSYTLTPASDGVIGQTPNLKVEVRLPNGTIAGTVDVGLGYTPGTALDVANGIKVSFSAGAISHTAGQFTTINAVADSDQSNILVATGVNALFDGHDASTISARQELLDNPDLLATGLGGGASDGSNIARMLLAKTAQLQSLGNQSVTDHYDLLIQNVGAGAQRAQSTLDTQQLLMNQLEARRQSVSGVNVDEELLQMQEFQRSFEAATRYTQTLAEVNQALVQLGR